MQPVHRQVGGVAIVQSHGKSLSRQLHGLTVVVLSAQSASTQVLGFVDVLTPNGQVNIVWIEELFPMSWGQLIQSW